MLIFLPAAATLGAKERARLDYVTEAFGNAGGIGTVAVVMAISLAVGGAVSGVITDRVRPQGVLAAALVVTATANFVTGVSLLQGPLSITYVVVVTAVEWLSAGVAIPALLKVQAALVPQDARGSAEIVNALRLGIGGMAGILLATVSPSTAVTLLGCAIVIVGVIIGVLIVTRGLPSPVRPREVRGAGTGLWSVLLADQTLRRVVIADLVLAFVVPTQLSNVVIVEEGDASLVLPVLLTGVLGVLAGRLVLLYTGSLGDVRRALLVSFGLYLAVAVGSVPLVLNGVTLTREEVAGLTILLGSALSAYALGLLAALVQQLVPDDVRGSLSGFMAAARSLLVAGAAALITAVVVPLSSEAVVVTVAVLGVAALAIVRGFSGIAARTN
jgi:MFS family permease